MGNGAWFNPNDELSAADIVKLQEKIRLE